MQNIMLKIDGMTCGGCANSVTRVLRAVAGVTDVQVAWTAGTAHVVFDAAQTSPQDLAAAVESAGFDVVSV